MLNLGLGGSALLDPILARTIRDQPTDLISLKVGINIAKLDVMRLRAFGRPCMAFLTRSVKAVRRRPRDRVAAMPSE